MGKEGVKELGSNNLTKYYRNRKVRRARHRYCGGELILEERSDEVVVELFPTTCLIVGVVGMEKLSFLREINSSGVDDLLRYLAQEVEH